MCVDDPFPPQPGQDRNTGRGILVVESTNDRGVLLERRESWVRVDAKWNSLKGSVTIPQKHIVTPATSNFPSPLRSAIAPETVDPSPTK